ncbi:predicted protein [Naegleria gruberi]|uniref:Predicted protein n=1 Tax=Naegleria gruberi TaxID=5762 RepID=D2VWJ3_NAEGR|nr:uncharacterized protein NAEGRDRAFT_73400 [Naegleria gruberi]EFC38850.1 predicted protein [Naegleria gruberi]|eukprot:XP_002671594.1 predicted protein [Naegleria gruberi strain NEG-M]
MNQLDGPMYQEQMKMRKILMNYVHLNLACRFGLTECVTEAFKRYQERNSTIIPPILRNAVYRAVVSNGGEREYYQILNQFKAEQDSVERTKLVYARFHSCKRPWIWPFLHHVKPQDSIFLIREVARNVPSGPNVAFVRTRYDAILSKCGQDQVSNRLSYGVGSLFTNIFERDE